MYEFYWKYIGAKYGSGAKWSFTDTNSLVYQIETDAYGDFYKDKSLFEFYGYPKDLRFFDVVNKKVICKMRLGEILCMGLLD